MEFLQALTNCSQGWIIHGNYLDDSEIQFLAQNRNLTLVYCPRTHAAFGHSTHPWRRLLELGGNVAIGTDSRASNPDLSLFAELQFLSGQYPDMSHLDLLKLACVRHSPPEEIRADLCLVEWGSPENVDPTTCLFAAENSICGTMVQGRWCYLGERLTELLDV